MSTAKLCEQLTAAKRRLSYAAAACLRNEPGAAEAADLAQAEVDMIRALMKAQTGYRECER